MSENVIVSFTFSPPPITAEVVSDESMSIEHLYTPEHAAPASVGGEGGPTYGFRN